MVPKQAAILEAPPAMVSEIGEWIQASVAATEVIKILDSIETWKQHPQVLKQRYAPLFKALHELRAVLPAGTPRILQIACKTVSDMCLGMFGHRYGEYPAKTFQKLDQVTRTALIEQIKDWCDRIEQDTEQVIHNTSGLEQSQRHLTDMQRFTRPGVPPLTGDTTVKRFKVDIKGWRYEAGAMQLMHEKELTRMALDVEEMMAATATDERMSPERLERLRKVFVEELERAQSGAFMGKQITVELQRKPDVTYARGWWSVRDRKLVVVIPEQVWPWNLEKSLMSTLRHELQHVAQTILREALTDLVSNTNVTNPKLPQGLRLPSPGMPSKKIMTPNYKQEDKRDDKGRNFRNQNEAGSSDVHSLDDLEFYPVLQNEIDTAREALKNLNLKLHDSWREDKRDATGTEQKDFLLWFAGVAGAPEPWFHAYSSQPFRTWKKFAPGKYRKALQELFRAFPVMAGGAAIKF